MKKKNQQAIILSKKEGISYKEAYEEMKIIKWSTGLSFSDYLKYDLHSVKPAHRFRKAEHIIEVREFRARHIKEICDALGTHASEVRKSMRALSKKYKGVLNINTTIYHDYELYKKDDPEIDEVVNALLARRKFTVRFKKLLSAPGSYIDHMPEFEGLYKEINALNSKLLTPTLINSLSEEFSSAYPLMATDASVARDVSLDFLNLRSAAGYNSLEYAIYDLYNKPLSKKLSYVSKLEKKELVDAYNSPSAKFLLDDKYSCYLKFRPYFRREVISVKSMRDLWKFWQFCRRHVEFVKKPLYSQQGKGIRKVSVKDYRNVREMLNKLLKEDGEFIAEELLTGHPSTSVFNEDSLNTLRILTFNAGKRIPELDEGSEAFSRGLVFYAGGGIYCLAAFFKTGRADSFVDNAGGGGVFSAVSLLDGKSSATAIDEKGVKYTTHPDSGVSFDSLQFDTIREACNLVAELAPEVPEAGFIGWDLALTEKKEWAVIEANYAPTFIGQAPAQAGIHEAVHALSIYSEH